MYPKNTRLSDPLVKKKIYFRSIINTFAQIIDSKVMFISLIYFTSYTHIYVYINENYVCVM